MQADKSSVLLLAGFQPQFGSSHEGNLILLQALCRWQPFCRVSMRL